jgi:quinoprotein glucose dehydrogenase
MTPQYKRPKYVKTPVYKPFLAKKAILCQNPIVISDFFSLLQNVLMRMMNNMNTRMCSIKPYVIFAFLSFISFQCSDKSAPRDYTSWTEYLGGSDRNHYSELTQITPENVKNLKIAWTYTTDSGQMQMSPIMVEGILYGVNARVQAFALDAATGNEIWKFMDTAKVSGMSTSRGVAYWSEGNDKRILYTVGKYLFALDAKTGKPIETFGDGGKIDLHTGLPESSKDKFIISNTPGTIFENLIIMPVRVSEGNDAASGDLRAFDVKMGKLAWIFHTIPYPDEFGYDTWGNKDAYKNTEVGGVNNWAGMAIDRHSGILFAPIGSAAPDFYGGRRLGNNLFSDCLLALDARTGKRLWHYQFIHHDMWDRDPPSPPNLIQVKQNGKTIDAVAQTTKQGYVFVFDRKTGATLFPINEEGVPQSNLTGEVAAATQPVPTLPKPFARQSDELTENDISPFAENKAELLEKFKKLNKTRFSPPDTEGSLLLPGYDGGAEWGGSAADPKKGILYVNSNEMAWILKMDAVTAATKSSNLTFGETTYITYCASCHGKERVGNAASGYPNLVNVGQKRDKAFVAKIIANGKGMMPGFPMLTADEKQAIVQFLFNEEKKEATGVAPKIASNIPQLPYKHAGYNKFLDSKGLPALSPPWGTLNAIDLNTGQYLWKIPLGETSLPNQKNPVATGCENYGGPVVTSNGLLFIAATKDEKLRAFDKKTGKLLWATKLPAAAFMTPAMYQVNGKQYLVVACGGEKLGTPKGNLIVAFALE